MNRRPEKKYFTYTKTSTLYDTNLYQHLIEVKYYLETVATLRIIDAEDGSRELLEVYVNWADEYPVELGLNVAVRLFYDKPLFTTKSISANFGYYQANKFIINFRPTITIKPGIEQNDIEIELDVEEPGSESTPNYMC